ncbi:hypothetical protein U1Q18_039741 [Sarracenia purpurea var. burkii]
MRTRNQSKRQNQSTGKEVMKPVEGSSLLESRNDGTLTAVSREAVGKLLKRVNSGRSSGLKKQDNYFRRCDFASEPESEPERADEPDVGRNTKQNALEREDCSSDAVPGTPLKNMVEGKISQDTNIDCQEEMDESFWEDGSFCILNTVNKDHNDLVNGVTIEYDGTPDSGKRKTIRRASAEDKELAELVHKVHLLCLLGRGRLIDCACNDPLIQFHNNFRIRSQSSIERSFDSAVAFALETQEGTAEEVFSNSEIVSSAGFRTCLCWALALSK